VRWVGLSLTSILFYFALVPAFGPAFSKDHQARNCSRLPLESLKCENGETYPIHLTFDDGPVTSLTPKVLDVLKEKGINATFFIMGEKMQEPKTGTGRYDHLIRRMQSEGHLIGSHSYKHDMHIKMSIQEIESYIKKAKVAGRGRLGNYLAPIFRLPYGSGWYDGYLNPKKSARIMEILKENGFTHVGWDVSSWDWDAPRRRNPGILNILAKGICNQKGGVILLHDIQKHTVDNLGNWIDVLSCIGHTFKPLEEFMPELKQIQNKKLQTECVEDCGQERNRTRPLLNGEGLIAEPLKTFIETGDSKKP
jgi:peptidoglycan/xylan/chitin deacetylase (PgdA/CDA1 family)